MEYTRLGSSGLKVSRIALGTMGFGDGTVPFWSWALPWAAISQKAGRVRVADQYYDVTFEAAGNENEAAIDAAYEAKYPGSPAVLSMQGDGPKSASVRISAR